jgi:hypothetical protein
VLRRLFAKWDSLSWGHKIIYYKLNESVSGIVNTYLEASKVEIMYLDRK